MLALNNVQTQDAYADATTLRADVASYAVFDVYANASAYVSYGIANPLSGRFEGWSVESLYGPSRGNRVENCRGVRFRSAVAGSPTFVTAQLIQPNDPEPSVGAATAQTSSASGAVSPGLAQVQIDHNAVLVGTESTLDFEDGAAPNVLWTLTDVANSMVKVQGVPYIGVQHNAVVVASEPSLDFEDLGTRFTWSVVNDAPGKRVKLTPALALVDADVAAAAGFALGKLATFPTARVTASAGQSVPSGGLGTALSFDTVTLDTSGMYSAANPTRLTAQTAGKYVIGGGVEWTAAAGTRRDIFLRVGGATSIAYDVRAPLGTINDRIMMPPTLYNLGVGGYVELLVVQDSGAALNTVVADGLPNFWAAWVGQ